MKTGPEQKLLKTSTSDSSMSSEISNIVYNSISTMDIATTQNSHRQQYHEEQKIEHTSESNSCRYCGKLESTIALLLKKKLMA